MGRFSTSEGETIDSSNRLADIVSDDDVHLASSRVGAAEDLRAAHNILDHEAKESVAMMRQVTMLDKDGALSALRSIYGPVETLSSTR